MKDRDSNLASVESLMKRLAHSNDLSRMGSIIEEQLSTGGKRLRARLALSAMEGFGGAARDAIPWAAACELLHNATLIHDDIQDGDKVRRGHPTVWVRHGQAQAINAGDLMLMLPFSALVVLKAEDSVKWRLSLALAEAAQMIVRGQSFEGDLLEICDRAEGFDEYLKCVRGKTAALFRLPVEGAGLLSGVGFESARAIAKPFEDLGVLFQMQDDVLDLYGNKGREKPGHDLREGKVSCLVVEHMRRRPADRAWLKEVLRKPRGQTSEEDVASAMRKFVDEGTLDAILRRMNEIVTGVLKSADLSRNQNIRELALSLAVTMLDPIQEVMSSHGLEMRDSWIGAR